MAHLDNEGYIVGANKEIAESQRELYGWADRIIASILGPLRGLEKYPLGHGNPQGKTDYSDLWGNWGKQ